MIRAGYRAEIPALAGVEFDFVFHEGAMSRDVSDDEGKLTTRRPGSRASWVSTYAYAFVGLQLT
jgi:hypothetical protein